MLPFSFFYSLILTVNCNVLQCITNKFHCNASSSYFGTLIRFQPCCHIVPFRYSNIIGGANRRLFQMLIMMPLKTIHTTVVQSIELQGNRCGTGKSCQNSSGTGIAKFAGAAPLMTQWTDSTGVAPVKGVPPAKTMSPWSGGTGIAKFAGVAPFMTVHLTAIQGAVPSKVVPPAKVVPPWRHYYSWCHPPCQGGY